ncbi:hypothetical protein [Amycolatopsis sp. lyj-346]|uniref:hypothetical protein n=1 Tax=Amycolatopsis sp. lyj-346 TaxID=2789289 RepID=UPI003979FEC0
MEHQPRDGRPRRGDPPAASWLADPSPIEDVDAGALWMFTLEDDRTNRKITAKGVERGRGRHYIADWMVGPGWRCGCGSCRTTTTRSRCSTPRPVSTWAPRSWRNGRPRSRPGHCAARARRARQLRADLAAAEKSRRTRYDAVTPAAPAQWE